MRRQYQKEELISQFFDRELLRRLFYYLKPFRWLILAALAILIMTKVIEALVPVLIGYLSQNILNGGQLTEAFFHTLFLDCFIIFFLLLVAYILECFNVWIRSYVGQKATLALRCDIFSHVQALPIGFFDKNPIGRLMTRTIHDVDQIHQMFSESLVPLIGNMILFLCIFIGITYVNWKVAVAVLCIFPVVFWVTNRFRIHQRWCYEKIRSIISAMNGFVQEAFMGISIIRGFGLEKQERKIFEEMNEDHCDAYLESIHNFSFFMASIDFFQNLTLITAFVLLAFFIPFQAGAFFTFSLYSLMIFRPLADLAERYNVLQAAMAGASRVFSILDQPAEAEQKKGKINLQTIDSVVFDDVWFAYEEDNYVLKGLSFTLKKGESLALVGITGAGKTTIISLLLRFYEVTKGQIRINDRDLRDYTLESLRLNFSIVLQDPVLFSGTIAENITLFQPVSRQRVRQAVDYVNLTPLIEHLPEGLDHQIGERGAGLSVGEMQLISLARAVAHGRSLVILDEATANIDTVTEKLIQDALRKILQNKMALVIAHRLSTIRDVARIVVISDGKVAESGTHGELVAAKGLYEKLYRLQFTNL